jgi:hypothetical protein
MHIFTGPKAENNNVGSVIIRCNKKLIMRVIIPHFPLRTIREFNPIAINRLILRLKLLKIDIEVGFLVFGSVDV